MARGNRAKEREEGGGKREEGRGRREEGEEREKETERKRDKILGDFSTGR